MSDFCDDWVGTVARALTVAVRVHVHVGDNIPTGFPAVFPERTQPATVNLDDAVPQRASVDVVVLNEFLDTPLFALPP